MTTLTESAQGLRDPQAAGDHLTRTVLRSVDQNGSIAGIRRALARWTTHDVMRIIVRTERLGLITKRLPGRYETTAAGDAVIYGDTE